MGTVHALDLRGSSLRAAPERMSNPCIAPSPEFRRILEASRYFGPFGQPSRGAPGRAVGEVVVVAAVNGSIYCLHTETTAEECVRTESGAETEAAGKLGGDLAETLTRLREQLLLTQIGGVDKDLRFEMQEIELELNLALAKDAGGKIGLKFWVISADAEGKVGSNATQRVRLKMRLVDTRPQPDLPQETKSALLGAKDKDPSIGA